MHHFNARRATMMLLGTAALLFATPAFAGDAHTQGNAVPPGATLPPDVEVVPIFAPGEQIAIACDALQYTKANSDVRVVLTISAEPGETSPGYHQVWQRTNVSPMARSVCVCRRCPTFRTTPSIWMCMWWMRHRAIAPVMRGM